MQDMAKLKCRIIAEREATKELMRRLPALMENANITRAELMDLTGINRVTVNALCFQEYESSISADAMLAIADALHVSLFDLVGR